MAVQRKKKEAATEAEVTKYLRTSSSGAKFYQAQRVGNHIFETAFHLLPDCSCWISRVPFRQRRMLLGRLGPRLQKPSDVDQGRANQTTEGRV